MVVKERCEAGGRLRVLEVLGNFKFLVKGEFSKFTFLDQRSAWLMDTARLKGIEIEWVKPEGYFQVIELKGLLDVKEKVGILEMVDCKRDCLFSKFIHKDAVLVPLSVILCFEIPFSFPFAVVYPKCVIFWGGQKRVSYWEDINFLFEGGNFCEKRGKMGERIIIPTDFFTKFVFSYFSQEEVRRDVIEELRKRTHWEERVAFLISKEYERD